MGSPFREGDIVKVKGNDHLGFFIMISSCDINY